MNPKSTALRALTAGLSLLSCGLSHAQNGEVASPVVGVHRVAGDVYMLDTDTRKFEGGNMAVLVGAEGLLLVDTNSGSHTSAIVAALKKLADRPVRYVINTHCHGDHTGGNAVFQRAGATVIAQSNVRKRLEQDKCDEIQKDLPTLTFDSELTLDFDGEEVTALKLPTSHTDGDAMVYFKHANVVHTGDVFVSINLPFRSKYAGGDILGLADALREIVRRVPEDAKVIPGHGPQASMGDIRRAIRILDEMRDAVAVGVKQGKTLDELTKMKLLSPWQEALGAGDDGSYYLRDFYNALTGVPLEPKFRLN
jgi:cyclase